MLEFGWTRLAYLTITLAVLAALVRLGPPGLNSLSNHFSGKEALANTTSESTAPEGTSLEKTTFEGTSLEGTTLEETTPEQTAPAKAHARTSRAVSTGLSAARTSKGMSGRSARAGSSGTNDRAGRAVLSERRAPTFYRSVPKGGSRSAGRKACKNVGRAPAGSRIVFPVPRKYFNSFEDSWGAARVQGGHEGTDLMVPAGTPEFAMTDGVVVPVSGSNAHGWNYLGGYTVMVRAAYSIGPVKEGDIFYYAHMNRPTALRIGEHVKAGQVVGYAGATGQGPEGTSGLFPPHLHFGWYDVTSGRSQVASGAMDPYPLLVWVEKNGGSIKGGSNAPYCEAPAPAVPTPATGGSWSFPSDPGTRPDLSTGTNSALPTPAAPSRTSAESSPNVVRERITSPTAARTTATRRAPTVRKHSHAAGRPRPRANVPETTVPRSPAQKVRPYRTLRRGIAQEVRRVGAEVSGTVRHLLHSTSGKSGKPPGRSGSPHQRGEHSGAPGESQYRNGPEAPATTGAPEPSSKKPAPTGKPPDKSPACTAGGKPSGRHHEGDSGKPCGGSSSSGAASSSSGGAGKPAGRSGSPPASSEKPNSATTNSSGASKTTPPNSSAPETTSAEPPPGDSTAGVTSSDGNPIGDSTVGETTSSVESTGPATSGESGN